MWNAHAPQRPSSRSGFSVLLVILALGLFSPTATHATDHDSGMWTTVSASHKLANQWSAGLLVQTRLNNDFGDLERTVLRPSMTYKPTDYLALTIGYDAHFIEKPNDRLEQRIWQQVAFNWTSAPIAWTARARLEERFIEGVDGAPLRLRLMARGQLALNDDGLYAAMSNEYFVNLDETRGGPRDGFDQNRFYVGLGRPLNERIKAEVGYQMQYINRAGEDVAVHQLMLSLALN